ncbi:MAG: histidine phosphatase family protein [Flavobacteriaceae bacterium]|nr:histidine phosphatase family protein [Flavobacteriaceae bacterium]
MKRLILIRHAKSSWKYDVDDEKRPLKKRGILDAGNIGKALKEKGYDIAAIYSSPATRALETATIVTRALGRKQEDIVLVDQLYDFSGSALWDTITNMPETQETVLVFGHNYAITNLVNTYGSKEIDSVPTAGLTVIEFGDRPWKEISAGETTFFLRPKSIRQ